VSRYLSLEADLDCQAMRTGACCPELS
jgi:hypothetical protein